MTALTTRQRDLLQLLLNSNVPQGAAKLAEQMQLTPRQVNYDLKGSKKVAGKSRYCFKCNPRCWGPHQLLARTKSNISQTKSGLNQKLQLVLTAEQRQQLLVFLVVNSY